MKFLNFPQSLWQKDRVNITSLHKFKPFPLDSSLYISFMSSERRPWAGSWGQVLSALQHVGGYTVSDLSRLGAWAQTNSRGNFSAPVSCHWLKMTVWVIPFPFSSSVCSGHAFLFFSIDTGVAPQVHRDRRKSSLGNKGPHSFLRDLISEDRALCVDIIGGHDRCRVKGESGSF